MRAARSIAETGSFDALAEAATYSEINDLFSERRGADIADA
jgi:hypothetical protein